MPAGPGESHLTTLFADVHYYFSDPSANPPHHRFDRGSYVYLFRNPTEGRVKLEIANHAGTPDQDAFSGYLDAAKVTCSHEQPNLISIAVDAATLRGHEYWHLPSYNEKNEQKYLYRIHALDVYFWTEKDGQAALKYFTTTLPANGLDIKDAPLDEQQHVEHNDSMSTVVQQLERTAISPPFMPERQEGLTSRHSHAASPPDAASQSALMGYNPAAPAAPEPIAHREKTPPPLDAGSGTGLQNAARYESAPLTQYAGVSNTFQSPPASHTPRQAYFSGPPHQSYQPARNPSLTSFAGPPSGSTQPSYSGSFPPPPPPPVGNGASPQPYMPSFAPPPTQQTSASQPQSPPPSQQSFGPQSAYVTPGHPYGGYTQHQPSPSFGPLAVASPGLSASQQHEPPTPSAPPAYTPGQDDGTGIFAYSNYNYSASQPTQQYGQGGTYSGDIHSQVYRPTSEEAGGHGGHGRPQPHKQQSERRQQAEDKVAYAEAKVGKYLKKLDKLW